MFEGPSKYCCSLSNHLRKKGPLRSTLTSQASCSSYLDKHVATCNTKGNGAGQKSLSAIMANQQETESM